MPTYLLFYIKCNNYSRGETNQLLIIRRFWPQKEFKGGNYSKAETICGNRLYVYIFCFLFVLFRIFHESIHITKLCISSTIYRKYNFVLAYFDHKKICFKENIYSFSDYCDNLLFSAYANMYKIDKMGHFCCLKISNFWPPPPILVVFLITKIGNFRPPLPIEAT